MLQQLSQLLLVVGGDQFASRARFAFSSAGRFAEDTTSNLQAPEREDHRTARHGHSVGTSAAPGGCTGTPSARMTVVAAVEFIS